MSAREDLAQLNDVIKEISERLTSDPEYREELRSNQVERLDAAGMSALLMTQLYVAEGAEAEEVSAYGMDLMPMSMGSDPIPYHFNSYCRAGTCPTKITVQITIGASKVPECQGK